MKRFLFSTTFTSPFADWGLLALRAGIGLMMAFAHGYGKFNRVLSGDMQFGDPLGLGPGLTLILAVLAEFFCSFLIVFGLLTRVAVVPLIITMLTAVFIVHADDPFARQELGLLYLFPYILLLLTGPGRFSLDAIIGRKMLAPLKSPEAAVSSAQSPTRL
ncbi:DoxX family membrane protein [candidate division GN15 bacterium]|nr:DoxX family membrane protein [candidate division GN15 bacterium]